MGRLTLTECFLERSCLFREPLFSVIFIVPGSGPISVFAT